jgi:hypothetical protein
LPRPLALSLVSLLLVAGAGRARAADDEAAAGGEDSPAPPPTGDQPSAPTGAGEPALSVANDFYPPAVDGPALRLPEPRTRLYLDGAYAISNDLSSLPYIAGKGRNIRIAAGGAWRWRRFAFDAQVPFNITTIDIAKLLNQDPAPEDKHQTAVSLGDLAAGAVWSERLAGDSEAVIAGVGLRGRLATHTTRFQVHLADNSLAIFTIPYYFHVEPTLILGGALGPFTYVVNQGGVMLIGPDGNIQDQVINVPTIYLWDAHYAVGLAPWSFLGASVELATLFVVNHVDDPNFKTVNGLRAVWVAPALQIHAGDWRIDLIARLGLNRGQELYGVLEYVGTHSFTLRVTRGF